MPGRRASSVDVLLDTLNWHGSVIGKPWNFLVWTENLNFSASSTDHEILTILPQYAAVKAAELPMEQESH